MRKSVRRFLTRSNTNWTVQSQKKEEGRMLKILDLRKGVVLSMKTK